MCKKVLGTPRLFWSSLFASGSERHKWDFFLNFFVLMLKYFKVRTRIHVVHPEALQCAKKLFFPQKFIFPNEIWLLCNDHLQWLDMCSVNAAVAQNTRENSILRWSLEAVASYVELVSKNMFSYRICSDTKILLF